ncbi:MAG: transcriptional repressor LexA [Bifidobacteriaceae bacterium]|jgi:repressor LexA|nr:transcriptional repressor LexA [Bifidobacteriaceae bacterium]
MSPQATRSRVQRGTKGLTPRQRAVLDCIMESLDRRGYPPSMREIAAVVNLKSPSSVKHQLLALESKGYLRRDPHMPRAMEVMDPDADVPQRLRFLQATGPRPRYVPLVGRIAAGVPILAEQMVDGLYPLPREIVGDGEVFMLKVQGDSMIGAAIADGDMVVVRAQPSAENGEIVAALLDDEATIKTLSVKDGRVWLVPQNPAYQPIEGHKATILGKVVSVVRSL